MECPDDADERGREEEDDEEEEESEEKAAQKKSGRSCPTKSVGHARCPVLSLPFPCCALSALSAVSISP